MQRHKNMSEKFQNKYRIPSARAEWHDYDGGVYFVTICTANREHFFGTIVGNGHDEPQMQLSEIGKYVNDCIVKMETLHDNINVPLYQIMPNHIHLIIIIKSVKTCGRDVPLARLYKEELKNEKFQQIANKQSPLSKIINHMKGATTRFAKKNAIPFTWQTRFHDHIVRDQNELNRIAEYIETNVGNWHLDEYNI